MMPKKYWYLLFFVPKLKWYIDLYFLVFRKIISKWVLPLNLVNKTKKQGWWSKISVKISKTLIEIQIFRSKSRRYCFKFRRFCLKFERFRLKYRTCWSKSWKFNRNLKHIGQNLEDFDQNLKDIGKNLKDVRRNLEDFGKKYLFW